MKNDQLTRRRYHLAAAEEERWGKIEGEWAVEEARQTARLGRGVPSNKSSVPYNPLTLQYADTPDGEQLKLSDDQIRHRAALRAERLRLHQTKEGINPITGEALPPNRYPS